MMPQESSRERSDREIPSHIDYFDGTLWDGIRKTVAQYPDFVAYDFMGKSTSYARFAQNVDRCAKALRRMGVGPSDRVMICLPNCPQAVELFYAVNAVGAVSVMVHPLSGEKEIEFYLRDSGSRVAVTMDLFYDKFAAVRENTPLETLIVTAAAFALPAWKKAAVRLSNLSVLRHPDYPRIPFSSAWIPWKSFLKKGTDAAENEVSRLSEDPAAILYSGGTTGTPKGIVLSNRNFNALAQQVIATNPAFRPGDKMLAVMPVFHGFGLGIGIHTMLFHGGRCLLVPRFTVKSYAKLLRKSKCNFIAGVPTLYEALLREPLMRNADLSSLKGVYSGGDSLSVGLKERMDALLERCGASVRVREGYGTTECVTASCLTPSHAERAGSIGLPFPDTRYKIVKVGTEEEVPFGEEGEICISGPTVMSEYWNRPEETAQALRRHGDGCVWVHTGDLGTMDVDGYVYFRQRIKRMIVTNGYNVYPSQIENVLDSLEEVHFSCVIGVPDSLRMQRVKAFVVLKEGVAPTADTKNLLIAKCRKYVAGYALPREIEFRDSLPKTLVGKVAYRVLEEEETKKERPDSQ